MAARTGQPVAAVFDAPYSLTLWTFVQFLDADRIARVLAQKDRLDLARYIAFATWDPPKLGQIERELLGDAGASDEIAAKETEMVDLARQIVTARRQRLTPPRPDGSS